MVEYSNANQWIMPEAHNIWVQYMGSEENDLDITFQGRIPSFPVVYFSWTPPNLVLQALERLPAGKALSTFSKRCQTTQQWVLRPQAQEYAVVIPTKYKDLHGWADCVDGFIQVVKQTDKMHIVPIGAIVGTAHLMQENAASGGMDSVWLVNIHVDLDTDWTVYKFRLKCLIQVYSCDIVYRILLFDIDIIYLSLPESLAPGAPEWSWRQVS